MYLWYATAPTPPHRHIIVDFLAPLKSQEKVPYSLAIHLYVSVLYLNRASLNWALHIHENLERKMDAFVVYSPSSTLESSTPRALNFQLSKRWYGFHY